MVVSGQVVLALVSTFEPRDGDQRDAEVVGDDGEVMFGLPGLPKVSGVVDRTGRPSCSSVELGIGMHGPTLRQHSHQVGWR